MDAYAPDIERMMKRLFDSLGENDRRRYAAVEATKLGHGGVEYIARPPRLRPQDHPPGSGGTGRAGRPGHRSGPKKGGGRKPLIDLCPALEENFLKVLQDHTAGDPMRAEVKWTNLSRGRSRAAGARWGRRPAATSCRSCSASTVPPAEALKKKTMGPPPGPQRPVREHRPPRRRST